MPEIQNNNVDKCALCSIALTPENNSAEHIIPNAIGGRLKVNNFICENCNHTSGKEWEAPLTQALNPLSVHFQIKRQRGTPPDLKFVLSDGVEHLLKHDGNIIPARAVVKEHKISETETEIKITANNHSELKKHLKGLKRKHPNIDVDELLKSAQASSKDLEEPIHFQMQFGGVEFGKSLVKSALAWAKYNNIDSEDCGTALNFLRHDNIPACYDYLLEQDVIINRPKNEIFHCVAISNHNPDKQLLAYVEYYNVYRLVIILAKAYSGKDVHEVYAINPLSAQRLNIDFELNYSAAQLHEMFHNKNPNFEGLKMAFENTLAIHNVILQQEQFIDRIISESGYDPEQALTESETLHLCGRLADEIVKKFKKLF